MTASTSVLFTASAYATFVEDGAQAIHDAASKRGSVAALFQAMAAPAYGDADKQNEVAALLSAIRSAAYAKRERALPRIDPAKRDHFKKSVENSIAYAFKTAGDAAGCKFKFDRSAGTYTVAPLALKGEGQNTANGKDEKSAEQSSALVAAAEAAPVLVKGDRLAHLQGVMAQLIQAGYSMAEIEAAAHAVAMIEGKRKADDEQAEQATKPKAPAILAAQLPAVMASKGAKVKAPRKAKAKPAASASAAA